MLRLAGVLATVGTVSGGGRYEMPQPARDSRPLSAEVARLQRVQVDAVAGDGDEIAEIPVTLLDHAAELDTLIDEFGELHFLRRHDNATRTGGARAQCQGGEQGG